MKIGIAGTGRMGTAIARRLIGSGHEVRVWNRTVDNTRVGAGARMHLAATLLLAFFGQGLGESLLRAEPPAMDAARAIDLLADSNIAAGILRARATQIVAAMNGDIGGAAAFDVDTMRKDLRYMAQEAAVHGSSLPLASRTLECFDRASLEGPGRVDGVAYPAYWIAQRKAAGNGGPQPATNAS